MNVFLKENILIKAFYGSQMSLVLSSRRVATFDRRTNARTAFSGFIKQVRLRRRLIEFRARDFAFLSVVAAPKF